MYLLFVKNRYSAILRVIVILLCTWMRFLLVKETEFTGFADVLMSPVVGTRHANDKL